LRLWKAYEFGPMGDADHGGLGQFPGHQFHHLVLALGVERRCRFIEHDNVGIVQKQPREGEPLFFASRQRLVPRRVFLDFVLEMAEADLVERFADLLQAPIFGGARIGHGAAQPARRHIRFLRQHEQPPVGMKIDAAATPRP
jgi:hypothetical protein